MLLLASNWTGHDLNLNSAHQAAALIAGGDEAGLGRSLILSYLFILLQRMPTTTVISSPTASRSSRPAQIKVVGFFFSRIVKEGVRLFFCFL